MQVSRAILEHQEEFFTFGPAHLNPLRLADIAQESLAARNAELNRQLQGLICQIEKKVQSDLQNRESDSLMEGGN